MARRLHSARGDGCSAVRGGHARGSDWAHRGGASYGSPGRDGGGRTLTRVGLLGSGLVAAAGALGGYAAQASAAGPVQVWGLDPEWGDDPAACGCSGCASCRAHGANKLFASAAAADAGRAHLHCRCLVVPLVQLDEDVYKSLFVNGGGRDSVDRRYQWVQAVFAHDQSAYMPPIDTRVRVASGGASAPAARAVLGRVRIRTRADGQRALIADFEGDQTVTVGLAIMRQGSPLARRVVTGVTGSRRLKLPIPGTVKAGPARLRVRLTTASGTSRVVVRGIQIPRA